MANLYDFISFVQSAHAPVMVMFRGGDSGGALLFSKKTYAFVNSVLNSYKIKILNKNM